MTSGKIFTFLIILLILFFAIGPDVSHAQNNDIDSGEIPTWTIAAFWGSFAVLLGKVFIYDTFFNSSTQKNEYSLVDSSYNAIKYILDSNQIDTFKNLENEEERMNYLNTFWTEVKDLSNRDELRREFEKRVALTDSMYSLSYKRGWKTDRGRIYILYGKPYEKSIEPYAADPFLKINNGKYTELEIWYYDFAKGENEIPINLRRFNDGRTFFVFCRRNGHTEFEQIFSTEAGEKIDPGLYGITY